MSSELSRLEESQRLHASVREFAARSVLGAGDSGAPRHERRGSSILSLAHDPSLDAEFEALALRIAAHQTGRPIGSLLDVVRQGVASDCFRLGSVFTFETADAKLRFVTSGTTGSHSGTHYMRESATYEELSLLWGGIGLGLRSDEPPTIVVALAPWTGITTPSSLGYMMQRFMERFDGRSLTKARAPEHFALDAPGRWLVSSNGLDVSELRRVCRLSHEVGCRLTILATSFALVELLDVAGDETFPLPSGSVVMTTGGFKGRTRTIEPTVMHAELRRLFGDVDVVGEYGMTELTSQLYEGTARHGELAAAPGVYLAPPWLRVIALDQETLEPLAPGRVGLACFIDLGNVDSAVCLLTQDLVVVDGSSPFGGNRVRLLGRQPKAPLRGCSLAIEALLRPELEHAPDERARWPQPPLRDAGVEDGPRAVEGVLRVEQLVNAARVLADSVLGEPELRRARELAESSGLSVEGVRLAIELSLETGANARDVATLVQTSLRTYGPANGTVWVLLSSNVFTAPLRAIACATALSPHVKVRPSRRDPLFTHWLAATSGMFEVTDELTPAPGDLVLAFGNDETLAKVRGAMPPTVHFFGHGHGMGAAVVARGAVTDQAISALALDIVLFDQQGCASPRLVLLEAGEDAEAFAARLAAELAAWSQRVPPGRSSGAHTHERIWSERVARNLGKVFPAGEGWVAYYETAWAHRYSVPVPPACRSVSLVQSADPTSDLIALRRLLTNVGVAGPTELTRRMESCLPGARVVPLGSMQRPAFDGPLDRRCSLGV